MKRIALFFLHPLLAFAYPSFSFEQITQNHYQQVHYNEQGKPWLTIQGQHTLTQPSLKTTALREPRIEWEDERGHWSLRAKEAHFHHQQQKVICDKQVVLRHTTAHKETTVYRTEHIDANLQKHLITSNDKVEVTQGDQTMITKGLSLRLGKK